MSAFLPNSCSDCEKRNDCSIKDAMKNFIEEQPQVDLSDAYCYQYVEDLGFLEDMEDIQNLPLMKEAVEEVTQEPSMKEAVRKALEDAEQIGAPDLIYERSENGLISDISDAIQTMIEKGVEVTHIVVNSKTATEMMGRDVHQLASDNNVSVEQIFLMIRSTTGIEFKTFIDESLEYGDFVICEEVDDDDEDDSDDKWL